MPARVQGVRVVNVSARAFSLRWEQAVGCVDHYLVTLLPNQGSITVHPACEGYIQVNIYKPIQHTARTRYRRCFQFALAQENSPKSIDFLLSSDLETTNCLIPPFNMLHPILALPGCQVSDTPQNVTLHTAHHTHTDHTEQS